MHYFKDITGMKFGRLLVIKRLGAVKHGQEVMWECQCDCGNNCIVKGTHLRNGTTRSCGCLKKELLAERARKRMLKHGGSKTRLYTIWACMKNRCSCSNNTHFNCYGGRGIKVCDEWKDFENFQIWAVNNGYGENLTLDRIDNDGNYEPSNCRWVTRKEQSFNRRTNHIIEFNGEQRPLGQWAEIFGIHPRTIKDRLGYGWSVEKALTQPPRRKRNKED